MKKKLLHTPDGVRDIMGNECARKLTLENRLYDGLKLYGYSDIQTPSYEFFDIFSKEKGSVAANEMFKFDDRNGDTIVLRPDMTPSIARAAAKYFEGNDNVYKLCYKGNTFINNSSYQGRFKETTQMGAELIGDSSLSADAEIIAMVIEALLNAGLKEFQVEIGNVAYFRGILASAGIELDVEEELVELILNKSYFGVKEVLENNNIDPSVADTISELSGLFGSVDILDKAKTLVDNNTSLEAVKRLEDLYKLLQVYGYERYVSFDLGMLSKHSYYTGVIFNAFTYGSGEAIIKGGRYDKLIGQFGKEKASIGFSITIDQLMLALSSQKIDVPMDDKGYIVLAVADDINNSIKLSKVLRSSGNNVNSLTKSDAFKCEDCVLYAKEEGYSVVYDINNGKVTAYDIKKNSSEELSLDSLCKGVNC